MINDFRGKATTRGLRNNNPGNIRKTSNAWSGKIPHSQNTDGAFEQFHDVRWGIRAIMIDLRSKINQGNNTIAKIITKYAPASENNTVNYINSVVNWTGISAVQELAVTETVLKTLAKAIVRMEIGNEANLLTDAHYNDAYLYIGYQYGSSDLPELTINSFAKKCKWCGEIIAIVGLFFFTYLSITM